MDVDQEPIDVSDDENLLTAYYLAEADNKGNLKLIGDFKKSNSMVENDFVNIENEIKQENFIEARE